MKNKVIFDYTELKLLILRKYGTLSKFCETTNGIDITYLSRIFNNKIGFSQKNMIKVAELLDIKAEDMAFYFFSLKV